MEAKKLFFMECRVAGRKYHDADEVWEQLKVGTKLTLVRDRDNHYDPQAVAIVYDDPAANGEESGRYVLGYVPRLENEVLAKFCDMGWVSIFDCRICKIMPEAHYEEQLHVCIRIKRNSQNFSR